MVHDYTKFPAGHYLPDGRRIGRCPVCGRNGVVSEDEIAFSAVHFEYEPSATDDGAARAAQPRRNAVCRREKPAH